MWYPTVTGTLALLVFDSILPPLCAYSVLQEAAVFLRVWGDRCASARAFSSSAEASWCALCAGFSVSAPSPAKEVLLF